MSVGIIYNRTYNKHFADVVGGGRVWAEITAISVKALKATFNIWSRSKTGEGAAAAEGPEKAADPAASRYSRSFLFSFTYCISWPNKAFL